MANPKNPPPGPVKTVTAPLKTKTDSPTVELEGDSIEVTVPKLSVERIKMKFGGIRIAIHDADKT